MHNNPSLKTEWRHIIPQCNAWIFICVTCHPTMQYFNNFYFVMKWRYTIPWSKYLSNSYGMTSCYPTMQHSQKDIRMTLAWVRNESTDRKCVTRSRDMRDMRRYWWHTPKTVISSIKIHYLDMYRKLFSCTGSCDENDNKQSQNAIVDGRESNPQSQNALHKCVGQPGRNMDETWKIFPWSLSMFSLTHARTRERMRAWRKSYNINDSGTPQQFALH